MTERLYVIPDIHGHLDKLESALALIERDGGADARVVFLGDYVDRGPDSRGVIDRLIRGFEAGRNWTALRGNHDQMFLDFLDLAPRAPAPPHPVLRWFSGNLGASQTLASYGVAASARDPNWEEVRRCVPAAHREFLASLPLCLETDALILVHAGLRPGIPLDAQEPEDLLWIRGTFLHDRRDHGKLVVHGHTPVDSPEHHGNRIALDGGAGWGMTLHVAVFEGRDCWLLTRAGRLPLLPPR